MNHTRVSRSTAGVLVSCFFIAFGGLAHPPTVHASGDVTRVDYNGDGLADVAIAVPGEIVNAHDNAGAVEVIYGSVSGLRATGSQFITELSIQALTEGGGLTTHTAQAGDRFGTAVASGDFDHDGFADLVIGAPGQDLFDSGGNDVGADYGAVFVLWGSANGLAPSTNSSERGAIGGTATEHLGNLFATLDIVNASNTSNHTTGDGIDDLAVGTTISRVKVSAGGHRNFLSSHFVDDLKEGVVDGPMALVGGNIDSDAIDELLVGTPNSPAPGPGTTSIDQAGQLTEIQSENLPQSFPTLEYFYQSSLGGTDIAGDHFGAAVAVIGSGSTAQVLVGIPGKNVAFNGSSMNNAGEILVVQQNIHAYVSEASSNVPDDPEAGDAFGSSFAVGFFDDGTGGDVAIGVPGEQVGTIDNAGAVIVFFDNGTRKLFSQKTTGVLGTAASGDRFGASLSAANYGNGSQSDLAIGAPGDTEPSGIAKAGDVNVLYGSSTGLSTSNDQIWNQDTTGIANQENNGDQFGAALR